MAKLFSEKAVISALRLSLALIFIWFGALKIVGQNPVFDIVYGSWPLLAHGAGLITLGVFEFIIGLGLLFNWFPTITHIALFGHLIGTFSVFFLAPEIAFDPYFPFLTLAGEFVFKNITLLIAGFVVLNFTPPLKDNLKV